MFMVLVMFKPEGIAGMWQDLMGAREKRRRARTAPAPAQPAPVND